MRRFLNRLWSRIPRSYASLFPILSIVCITFISWYEITQVTADSSAQTIMAILGRMDKAAATAALFSVTFLEGGSMVLAHIFREEGHKEGREEGHKEGREEGHKEGREEGREEGIEIGRAEARAEAQAEIDELRKRIAEIEYANGKSGE